MSRHHRKKKKGRGHTIAIGALFVAEIAIILIIVFFFIVQGLLGKLKRVNTTPERTRCLRTICPLTRISRS